MRSFQTCKPHHERFIESQIATQNIAQLRDHLATQFLNVDESAALKDELDRVTQSAFEPTQQYVRRFREVADMAYPINTHNVDQERLLIKTFARGLAADAIAAKLVKVSQFSLEAAVILVPQACLRQDAYSRLGRTIRFEEPMEIGASDSDNHLDRTVVSLTSTMQQIRSS